MHMIYFSRVFYKRQLQLHLFSLNSEYVGFISIFKSYSPAGSTQNHCDAVYPLINGGCAFEWC